MKIILFPEDEFPIYYDTTTKEKSCIGHCLQCQLYSQKIEDIENRNCEEYIEKMITLGDYEIEKR